MTKADIGKALWARARAASLWQQADALDMDRGGDWRARAAEQGRRTPPRGGSSLRQDSKSVGAGTGGSGRLTVTPS